MTSSGRAAITPWRHAAMTGALCAVAAAAALWESLAGIMILAGSDHITMNYPFYEYVRDALRDDGVVPLWMPHLWCGIPFLGSMNSAALYPTELAAAWSGADAPGVFAWGAVLNEGIAGAGVMWWLMREGLPPGAARLGAVAYALGGVVFTQLGVADTATHRAAAWLPWLLDAHRAAVTGSGNALRAGGAIVALILCGLGIQTLAFALPWIAVVGALDRPDRTGRSAGCAAGMAALGAVAGAVWLIPALEYFAGSVRAANGAGFAALWAFHPAQFTALVWPGLWGRTSLDTAYIGPHPSDNTTVYPGLIALALAIAGAVAVWRTRWPWLAAGALAVLLSLGDATIAGRLLARMPPYGGFRGWGRWLIPGSLSFALCVAEGWRAIAAGRRAARVAVFAALGLAVAVTAAARMGRARVETAVLGAPHAAAKLRERADAGPLAVAAIRESVGRAAVVAPASLGCAALALAAVPPAGEWLLAAALAADLAHDGRRFAELRFPFRLDLGDTLGPFLGTRPGPFRVLSHEIAAGRNVRIRYDLEMISGYHGVPPAAVQRFLFRAAGASDPDEVMALLNVGYVIRLEPVVDAGLRPLGAFRNHSGRDVHLYEVRDPLPRVFFPRRLVAVPDAEAALDELTATDWSWRTATVETGVVDIPNRAAGRLVRWDAGLHDRTARVRTAGAAFAVFSERAVHGWRAAVDGVRVPVHVADAILIGVDVPKGDHAIGLRYDPRSFRLGLWLTCLMLPLLAVGSWKPR